MANPFGERVDDKKLNTIPRYVNKPKTQEDRAREAMHLINEDGKSAKAEQYVEGVKDDYGNGVSTKCMIYNATGEDLHYVTYYDWWGFVGRTPYPIVIGNGQWASFLHVHKTGDASGSEGAVVYRGKNKDGRDHDFLLAWSTPWSPLYNNKAYCDIGGVNQFNDKWGDIVEKINNSDYSHTANWDGVEIEADTATGGSPKYRAIIKIPFSP